MASEHPSSKVAIAWVAVVMSGGQVVKTRGLNRNFNRRLKYLFKGAATAVLAHRIEPLHSDYARLTRAGTKPPLAKLTVARRIAATVLAMWKNQEEYDPQRHRPQS